MKSWAEWVSEYLPFRETVKAITDKRLPDEIGQLQLEEMELAALESQAETHAAYAESLYRKRKGQEIDALRKEGWPRSAVSDVAKNKCYLEIFYRDEAQGLCEVIKSRAIKGAHFQKMLRP